MIADISREIVYLLCAVAFMGLGSYLGGIMKYVMYFMSTMMLVLILAI